MSVKHRNGPKHQHPTHAHPPVAGVVPETPPANLPVPPQHLTAADEAVRARAYHLWEAAGRPDGDGVDFWYAAEREMVGR